jgi:protein-ribulosamine 3-kinase
MSLWETIGADIAAATGQQAELSGQESTGGGCINQTLRVRYGADSYFVKLNSASRADMFAAEARGLQELRRSETLKVPDPVCWGDDGDSAYLVLEDLELGSHGDLAALGEGLAAMHRVTRKQFGWDLDNTIGSTLQVNIRNHDWVAFWREHRLQFQLELAAQNGHGGRLQSQGEKLLDAFPALFVGHSPQPSLLHGDLWSGNYAFSRAGEPTIYDPAVYYGDREADLAMTELFGGFGADFYAAYRAHYPLDPGYGVRKTLYNLYHILNHLNIFGEGYRSQAYRMMDTLLAELS